MATQVFSDAFLSVGGVDLSDHVKSLSLTYEAEALDETAMGATTRTNRGGLLNWSVAVEFYQDYASGEVDATLFPLVGTNVALIMRPDNSDGVGAANPNFSGTGMLQNYQAMGGEVGTMEMAPVTFVAAGALSRATS